MADEVSSSKAFYQMQYQECQLGLEKLLGERHQLRANLYDTYRYPIVVLALFHQSKTVKCITVFTLITETGKNKRFFSVRHIQYNSIRIFAVRKVLYFHRSIDLVSNSIHLP